MSICLFCSKGNWSLCSFQSSDYAVHLNLYFFFLCSQSRERKWATSCPEYLWCLANWPHGNWISAGISAGVIAGISIAVVAVVLFLVLCLYFGAFRRKKLRKASLLPSAFEDSSIQAGQGNHAFLVYFLLLFVSFLMLLQGCIMTPRYLYTGFCECIHKNNNLKIFWNLNVVSHASMNRASSSIELKDKIV